jgi:hyperosmotically inducible protein
VVLSRGQPQEDRRDLSIRSVTGREALMSRWSSFRRAGAAALLLAGLGLAGCDRGAQDAAQQNSQAPSSAPPATDGGAAPGGSATVDPGGMQATVDDTTVTAKVKAALLATDGIQATDISVETQQGVVILTGKVADATQAQRAQEIAQSVEGVRSVDNRLTTSSS